MIGCLSLRRHLADLAARDERLPGVTSSMIAPAPPRPPRSTPRHVAVCWASLPGGTSPRSTGPAVVITAPPGWAEIGDAVTAAKASGWSVTAS
jgi:hypothetical protein